MNDFFAETAYAAAERKLRHNKLRIQELQEECEYLRGRMNKYRGSTVLEAERVATAAEPYQITQLPEGP